MIDLGTVTTQFGVHHEVVREVFENQPRATRAMWRTRCGRVLPRRLIRSDEIVNCIGCITGTDIRA